MFTATFPKTTLFESQIELRSAFASDAVFLSAHASVEFQGEVTLGPGVTFSGHCRLSGPVRIDNGSILSNVRLGRDNVVRAYSILTDFSAGDRNLFGPFCFIRDNCSAGNDCILGAHVETTRSHFGSGVKISHRAFVGDAEVEDSAIIGAGVVFCNFDGRGRQMTRVGARATIGSGTLLVPPLRVGEDAIIAAGTAVTKDVAAGARLIQKR